MRETLAVVSGLALLIAGGWWANSAHRRGAPPPRIDPSRVCGPDAVQRTYFTRFPLAEDPISEHGNWMVSGGDFANVRTTPGFAFGTQTGTQTTEPQMYNDSTALLTGTWGPDQFVQIVVRAKGVPNGGDYNEVEIRLRSAISATSNTGYEIQCRVGEPGVEGYVQVGRVNGPLGSFPPSFDARFGKEYACRDGDVLTGTIVGRTLKAYLNGRQVLQADDWTYASGAPGIGFFHHNTHTKASDFGIASVLASDALSNMPVAAAPLCQSQ